MSNAERCCLFCYPKEIILYTKKVRYEIEKNISVRSKQNKTSIHFLPRHERTNFRSSAEQDKVLTYVLLQKQVSDKTW